MEHLPRSSSVLAIAALVSSGLLGCDPAPSRTCIASRDCASFEACVDGRCLPAADAGSLPRDGGSPDATRACAAAQTCGARCCDPGALCVSGACCAPADLCGGTCCGAPGEVCVADVCVLDCGARDACGAGASATCCADGDVCLLGSCATPGASCSGPASCPEGQYCDASLGHCLPRVTGPACEYRPTTEPFELAVEWHWQSDPDVMPLHDQVMSAPMVANLNDDNGDGTIDENDIPDVVFNTFRTRSPDTGGASVYAADGVLRAISGADGSRLWPTTTPSYRTFPAYEVAIADVRPDSPGPEVIGCTFALGTATTPPATYGEARLTIFSATGAVLHRFDTDVVAACGRPAVGDMDGDGVAEIAVGNRIVHADGSSGVTAAITGAAIGALYDVDGDGDLELIGLDGVAEMDGTALWVAPELTGESGYVAVADVDLDGQPDVVTMSSTAHHLSIRNGRTGQLMAGPIEITPTDDPHIAARVAAIQMASPGRDALTGGGPPTIANFDDDAEPEIALAGGYAYAVFDADLTRLWYVETDDTSSRATGSSVFDFEGDGVAEVLYNDEQFLRVFRGPTGASYLERCNTSGTLAEYPIVVDADNDGQAEILVVENDYYRSTCPGGGASSTGVWSFGHPRGQWVRTRRIWNEHSYHVTNVNEDGTLPLRERRNDTTPGLNNFRQNTQPIGLFDAPDLVLADAVVATSSCPGALTLRVRVVNQGHAGAPPSIPVAFYVDGAFVGTVRTTRRLLPGESEVVELRWTSFTLGTPTTFTAVVDDPAHDPLATLNECRTDNDASDPATGACTIPM